MKPVLLLPFLLFAVSCSQNSQSENRGDTTAGNSIKVDTLCFLHTSGPADQDTSFLRIAVDGGGITGDFFYLPYEKDARKGTIAGHQKDGIIKAEWVFMQEGVRDTLPVEFRMEETKLVQKEYSVDMETGRQFLSDTGRFTLDYIRINCN